ncbi:MAG: Holliday junction ATP-dependent DNA helicase RuvA [Parcubacteria group bacterium GW2011_GWA2_39_18]|nr:MAG: Holliday junction ATP-dependent DNA helicase RuvA [Parcubacteria group bacterium GW2011_GWA2_39_18]
MISYLSGEIVHKDPKFIILNTGGIGFKIFINPEFASKLPATGKQSEIYCSLFVRQDLLELFGFPSIEQLEFFNLLTTVSGVGPKTALLILGVAQLNSLKAAILRGEADILTKVSGVGKKTAERIIIDLKTKVSELSTGAPVEKIGENADVIEVLMSFGYTRSQINEALEKLGLEISGTGNKIKNLLKILGQKK